ncbi:MAG: patatin-like phospholipase family protein [Proteobacteria bacterium]|nr:patatin-like phospholipase family protein [Pseudomonadota bacterium]
MTTTLARSKPRPASNGVKRINLALQGGGAHGAYTWGVLDRLLEDGRLEVDGISGTSAGAMNAAVLAFGHGEGGNDGARAALERFWRAISKASEMSPLKASPWDRLLSSWGVEMTPSNIAFDFLSRLFSPYQFNPFNFNPLRDVLESIIDFDRLRQHADIKLYISATNVKTGRVRVFDCAEISADVLLASACLPFLFQAVEIDGAPYWDGGYMGNPSLFPLIYNCESKDVMIVQVNPLTCDQVPASARGILDRVNEISFNSTLMREMRAVSFVTDLLDQGQLAEAKYKRMFVHWIDAEEEMKGLGVSSKLNADWDFLSHLKDIGRRTADTWLAQNYDSIGRASSVDIRAKFL